MCKRRSRRRFSQLQSEELEPRALLSVSPVGMQPTGVLTGKIVYAHAGHGWTADNLGDGTWATQRGETFEIVEDLGNQDQMTFLADYLFRAGATVVPLRPVGHQPLEVVLDNDDPGVTFFGDWMDSGSSIHFGEASDVAYRFATTSAEQSASAHYRPDLPTSGFYPVYTWVRSDANRADQLYRMHHSGGVTEVTVDHRKVGTGVVYLGTYHFKAGTSGYVEISNRGHQPGTVVVADMIRFGNGWGDIDRGGGVSGQTREDEAGLYWIQWHADRSQGIPDSVYRVLSRDRSATVSASPRYAAFMNTISNTAESVFVSFHSNAAGGGGRGVLGLYNGNNSPNTATPHQQELAETLAREVNDDLAAVVGAFEHDWASRSVVTLDRGDIEFGEINNLYIQNEFDATIIETGFHDNQTDAEMLRDPKVRDAIARATYQGLVRYFHNRDAAAPQTMAPGKVSEVSVVAGDDGLQLRWTEPSSNSVDGDVPTGYRVYLSRNGYGFDGGVLIDGGTTTAHTFDDLEPDGRPYFFRVVALNAGGESPPSEVVAATPSRVAAEKVLIVNGFDRFDRALNPRQAYQGGTIDRVRPQQSNSFDYVVQVANSINDAASVGVDTAANEAVQSGNVALHKYAAVVWTLGEESSADDTFNAVEQALVQRYLANGGKLFVSGAEIAWDLDRLNNGRSFARDILRTAYSADDAGTYEVTGAADSIFAELSFAFDDGEQYYDAQYPDVLAAVGGAQVALDYNGGLGGAAATQFQDDGTAAQVVVFGFPFETVTTAEDRVAIMRRILDFFGLLDSRLGDFDGDGDLDLDDVNPLGRAISSGADDVAFDVTFDGRIDFADLDLWVRRLKGTQFGDANLDHVVDTVDLAMWRAHRFAIDTVWAVGDFNADGVADASDFNLWNENRFDVEAIGLGNRTLAESRFAKSVERPAVSADTRRTVPRPVQQDLDR